MADVLSVLTKLRDDSEVLRRFTEDPDGTLRDMGVDPSEVTIAKLPGNNSPYENFKQAVDRLEQEGAQGEERTICGSVGYFVCGSVGG